MGRPYGLSVLFAQFIVLIPSLLSAQTATVTGELAFRGKYLFAGIPFASEQVQQAKVTVGIESLTLNGFTVYDFDAGDITEADIYGDYYAQVSPAVGVFVGAALYNFKIADMWEATPEAYGGIVFTAPLNPTLYLAHDFDLGDGTHATLTLSHAEPLGEGGAVLNVVGNLDYNNEYYTPDSGFSFVDVSVALGFPVGRVTLSPMVLLQRRLDDVFAEYIPNEELFGVTATMTF